MNNYNFLVKIVLSVGTIFMNLQNVKKFFIFLNLVKNLRIINIENKWILSRLKEMQIL